MQATGLQNTKLTLKDLVWFVSLIVTISMFIWRMSAKETSIEARFIAIELKADANKQELSDHDIGLMDYKLDEIDKKLDKIMDKLDIN